MSEAINPPTLMPGHLKPYVNGPAVSVADLGNSSRALAVAEAVRLVVPGSGIDAGRTTAIAGRRSLSGAAGRVLDGRARRGVVESQNPLASMTAGEAKALTAGWLDSEGSDDALARLRGDGAPVAGGRRLTSSALLWLQRLPADPGAVSLDDARRLQALKTVVRGRSSDRALLESVADPILGHFERETRRANARAVLAHHRGGDNGRTAPASALAGRPRSWSADEIDTVADAVLAEFDQLTEVEAKGRARELLDEQWAATAEGRKVEADRQKAKASAEIEAAQAVLAELAA